MTQEKILVCIAHFYRNRVQFCPLAVTFHHSLRCFYPHSVQATLHRHADVSREIFSQQLVRNVERFCYPSYTIYCCKVFFDVLFGLENLVGARYLELAQVRGGTISLFPLSICGSFIKQQMNCQRLFLGKKCLVY